MRKEIVLVLASVFLLVYGTYVAGTILAPYAQTIGATGVTVGIITGTLYIVRLFVGTHVGRLADNKGVLTVLRYSLILYPFVALSYWGAVNVPALIGARLLHGLASAMMLPMAMAYMGEITPIGKEGYYMGIYNTIILVASGLGPQTATIITYRHEPKTAFLFLFIMAFISLLLVLMLTNNKANNKKADALVFKNNQNSLALLIGNPRLLALAGINVALAVISSLIEFFFILYPPTKGINLIFTGSIIAIYNIVCGASQIPIGRLTDKLNKNWMILFAGVLSIIVLVLFPFAGALWSMILCMFVLALVSAVILSASSALSTILGRNIGMGSTMGFLGTSTSVGMVIGSVLLSLMPGMFGVESIFYLTAGLVLISIIIFFILWGRKSSISHDYKDAV